MYEGIIVSFGVFIILGVVTYFGAWYTAKSNSPRALIGIYILFLTLAQFFAAKIAMFDLGFENLPFIGDLLLNLGVLPIFAPVGVIVFPFTLQVTDMVNEKFGRKTVYEMIWIALISQVIMVFLLILAGLLPAAGGKETDPLTPFAIVPAITLASWISFLISERFDAWIYDMIRSWIHARSELEKEWWKYLWIRNVFSDILSLGLDSIIFIPLAFLILPSVQRLFDTSIKVETVEFVFTLIIGQLITKWTLGLIDTPYMYLTRWIYNKSNNITKEES
ncbi:MAG: queuosine precursor transporter [Promethearchaeota archaeon]